MLLTGGSGLLGSQLQKLLQDILAPSRAELDVTDRDAVSAYVASHNPDIVIHAAAVTNNSHIEDKDRKSVV